MIDWEKNKTVFVAFVILFGCSIGGDLKEDLEDLSEDIGELEICDGMTLEELAEAKTISDECKADLEVYLPQPEQNFEDRLVALGLKTENDGSLSIYLHGVDADGLALDADDYASLTVTVGGELLAESEIALTATGDLSGDIMSMGIVNDYSGSMNESDLDVVAEIETDLLTVLPPIHETEVTYFSTEVSVKQPFTTDQAALLAAVARDEDFERDLTALYDGMGEALLSLASRDRPILLLLVSTDGAENESHDFAKPEIMEMVEDEGVLVVMLGALFADIDEMTDLMGRNGVYFYTPYYDDLKAQISEYIESLSEMIAVNIPEERAEDRPIEIEVNGVSLTIE